MEYMELILQVAIPAALGVYFITRGAGFLSNLRVKDFDPFIKTAASVVFIYTGAF